MRHGRPRLAIIATLALAALPSSGCGRSHGRSAPPATPRTYRMGFSWFPPRPDLALGLQVIDRFAPRADQALVLSSPPWAALLAGGDPIALVTGNELGLATHYRGKGLRVVASIDPTDGLDRSRDAPELCNAGRSLAEPAVQQLFRAYAVAMATLVQPDWLGLASETNLVRAIAPAALYQGVRQAAGDAAADVLAALPGARLFSTVQVEVAWGRPGNTYAGIDQDRADFPFAQSLGLSSYPYLGGFTSPEELPADYYSRLGIGHALPLFVLEGGWPSVPVAGVVSDPETQRRYIVRQAQLLDAANAIAWFQITFTDLEVSAWSPGIAPFADLGLVRTALTDKPALAAWDATFARPRSSGTAAR